MARRSSRRRMGRRENKAVRALIPRMSRLRRPRRQTAARSVFRRFIRVLEKLQRETVRQREKETGHVDA